MPKKRRTLRQRKVQLLEARDRNPSHTLSETEFWIFQRVQAAEPLARDLQCQGAPPRRWQGRRGGFAQHRGTVPVGDQQPRRLWDQRLREGIVDGEIEPIAEPEIVRPFLV